MTNWLETITRELTFALAKKGEKKEEAQQELKTSPSNPDETQKGIQIN